MESNQSQPDSSQEETVLITGGARGLGLAIALEYAKQGAGVAICSRTTGDLDEAKAILKKIVPEAKVFTYTCDVSHRGQVDAMIEDLVEVRGGIDVLVNNAGVILASPLENVEVEDVRNAFDSNLWGMVNTTFAILPTLSRSKKGRVLNVTSVGGLVPVPHLLSYSASKFAAVGFSTTLGLSLRRAGVSVTTAAPFLMRTGSFLHANFKGDQKKELGWFAKFSTLPLVTVSAERAARKFVRACNRRKPFVTVGWPVRVAQIGFALFPNTAIRTFGLAEKFLPNPDALESGFDFQPRLSRTGAQIETLHGFHPQTELGEKAATQWNERKTRS